MFNRILQQAIDHGHKLELVVGNNGFMTLIVIKEEQQKVVA